jgi:formamidopyrimidine-DNA glycosylase
MPELPEIWLRAHEIDRELAGRVITRAEFMQPKCLNIAPAAFCTQIVGQTIRQATPRGKWIFVDLDQHHLLLSLGMGGEVLLHLPGEPLPAKRQACFGLGDDTRLSVHFWWFGYLHLVEHGVLDQHTMTAHLGHDPLSPAFKPATLASLLRSRRTVKSVLLDQTQIAGIGNMYAHDILFRARVHPQRPSNSLSTQEIYALWQAIRHEFEQAIALGGTHWEKDLHGQVGRFDLACLLVGYKEGQPCPTCGTAITKIKTGATTGFVCERCQPL